MKHITDDERKIFEDAMYGVKAYQKRQPIEKPRTIVPKKTSHPPQDFFSIPQYNPPTKRKENITPVTGHDVISFAKTGLQHKKFSQLKKQKIKIEATLDLHEHNSDEALQATAQFIEHCRERGFRTVCIIHGKGLYSSDNNPVLKNLLNHYLRDHEHVIAFHSSKHNTGSVTVLLKSHVSSF